MSDNEGDGVVQLGDDHAHHLLVEAPVPELLLVLSPPAKAVAQPPGGQTETLQIDTVK